MTMLAKVVGAVYPLLRVTLRALRARMDTLVAVSACPDDAPYNIGYPKRLTMEIWA
jgi:uncharacterized protein YcgI (DUF1989 family)